MKQLLLLLMCLPSVIIAQDSDFNIYYDQAGTAFDNEDYDAAVINYTKCIGLKPEVSYLYYNRALSYRLGLDFVENNNSYRDLELSILDLNKALYLEKEKIEETEYTELMSDINFELGVTHLLLDDIDWCPFFVLSCNQGNSRACDSAKDLCE